MLLTLVPSNWSERKIANLFNCSRRIARNAKTLQSKKGFMSVPDAKINPNKLSEELETLIEDFYCNDENSRVCPGVRDYKIVKKSGEKIKVQKRLLLCNIKELYIKFKDKYPDLKLGFSIFAMHRPLNCLLAGQPGTLKVCTCIYHQNFKLKMNALKSVNILDPNLHYDDLIKMIICDNSFENFDCRLNNCFNCPSLETLQKMLATQAEENGVAEIKFKSWAKVDRYQIETFTQKIDVFIEFFLDDLQQLNKHSFVARKQTEYYNKIKENLNPGEFLAVLDFSENFSFLVQDAIQGFHWTNSQCTLHPIGIYYKDNINEPTKFTSLVGISESNNHDYIAVKIFIDDLIEFLISNFNEVSKIYFFSDGASGQYKNKKIFFNLCQMKQDYGIDSEWHFFATCHGKGPCDALGGTLKRQAARESIRRVNSDQITTAMDFYKWAVGLESEMNFTFISKKYYKRIENAIKSKSDNLKTVDGTRSFHCFIPVTKSIIKAAEISSWNKFSYFTLLKRK